MDEHRRSVAGFLGVVLGVGAAVVIGSVKPPLLRGTWLALAAAVVGLVCLTSVAAILPDLRGWLLPSRGAIRPPPGHVVIIAPPSDLPVPQTMKAQGTAKRVPLHVALVVQVGDKFYPQGRVQLPQGGTGNWVRTVHFGRVGEDVGQIFTLHAVGATGAANSRFEIFKQQQAAHQNARSLSRAAGTYPDLTPYASVSVIRGL